MIYKTIKNLERKLSLPAPAQNEITSTQTRRDWLNNQQNQAHYLNLILI